MPPCNFTVVNEWPSAQTVEKDFEPCLQFFRDVPREAWKLALEKLQPWQDKTTLKNSAWNAMCDLARKKVGDYNGLKIIAAQKRGRPLLLVALDGAEHYYNVRFNNLSNDLRAGGLKTGQRDLFEAQKSVTADAPMLPIFKPLVNLRAGYVLDSLGVAVVRTPIVLSFRNKALWAFDIDEPSAAAAPIIVLPTEPKPDAPRIVSSSESEAQKDRAESGGDE